MRVARGLAALLVVGSLCVFAAPASAQDNETLIWARASSCPLIRDYIARFPNGRYVATARTQLQARNCPDPEAAARAEKERLSRAEKEARDLREQLAREESARRAAEQRASDEAARRQKAESARQAATTTTTQTATTFASYDLTQLHPDVRRAAEAARAAETSGNNAAYRARRAQQTAQTNGVISPANGIGTKVASAGESYGGEFSGGVRSGVGVYIFGSLTKRYEGEWANDRRNGVGVEYFDGGEQYAGGEVAGLKSGSGIMRFPGGMRYEGAWRDDKYNGYGVLWRADGTVHSAGTWTNNALTTPLSR